MTILVEDDGSVAVKLIRDFAFPAEQVFNAWLKPEYLLQWMGPTDDVKVSNVMTNPIEGGSYHMQFNGPEDQTDLLNGVYKIINRFTRLVMTWTWEPPTEGGDEETLLSIDFLPIQGGTRLILLHQKFSTQNLAERHAWGWDETLLKFERQAPAFLNGANHE